MLSSVSRSMHMAFFLIDITERPTSMQPWSFPFFSCGDKTFWLAFVCMCVNARMWPTDGAVDAILTSGPRFAYFKMPFSSTKYLWTGRKIKLSHENYSFFHLWTHLNHRFIALFGYTTAKHICKKKGMQTSAPLSLDPAIHDDHV